MRFASNTSVKQHPLLESEPINLKSMTDILSFCNFILTFISLINNLYFYVLQARSFARQDKTKTYSHVANSALPISIALQ